jgi:Ca2+-binding RTX toxin-like protein
LAFTTIQGSGANDATSLVGTSGVDFASITSVENYFVGAQQSGDTIGITANIGTSTLKGGQGNDTFAFTAGATVTETWLNANSNNDSVGAAGATANAFTSTVSGGQGNDVLTMGTVNSSIVNGNKDADQITVAAAASSSIYGGQGVDNVTLNAGTHSNLLISGDLDGDTLQLTAASSLSNITLSGGQGNDTINGNAAMTSASGTLAQGGDGIDTINFAAFTQAVTIEGGNDSDIITGGTAADTLLGEAGGDVIATTGGNDTVTGGTGNDIITLSGGAQRVVQNAGDSTAATVAWTNINAVNGVLTDDNSAIVYGNGVDVVNTFATGVDTFASGTATQLASATNVNTIAAGNYFLIGDWAAGTQTFTLNSDTGADTLFITANGGSLGTAANNGTSSAVFIGATLAAGDFVA